MTVLSTIAVAVYSSVTVVTTYTVDALPGPFAGIPEPLGGDNAGELIGGRPPGTGLVGTDIPAGEVPGATVIWVI